MGCDCCKKAYPADYEKCQQDMERILRNRKPTSSKRYIASCCSYTFCIPYNDETKHLLGTTYEAPEFYKYWDE